METAPSTTSVNSPILENGFNDEQSKNMLERKESINSVTVTGNN